MGSECKRILIIDPDVMSVYPLYSDLIRDGFTVETSRNLREAVERIKDIKFCCVIMDVDLPRIKGYDAVSILLAIDPELKIIMTTNKNSIEIETEVRKQDIVYYYIKSFDREELVEAVNDVYKRQQKL
ncbi:MAG: response regulator [Sedimentisphaerales bacterium]|nr:response regulator [Sedimentisphaerales bacterium]